MSKNNLSDINKHIKKEPVFFKKLVEKEESVTVSMMLRKSEVDIVKKRAGELVPISTYLKHYLRTKTDLFKEYGKR